MRLPWSLKSIFFVGAVAVCAACVGCGDGGGDRNGPSASGGPPLDANGQEMVLDAGALELEVLADHGNPIVSNNAKRAVEAIKQYHYKDAATALATVVSFGGLEPQHRVIAAKALGEVKRVAAVAAASGDEGARFAIDYLADIGL